LYACAEVQDVITNQGRAYVMRAFINTIRFARTVINCNWLPEAPVLRLFNPTERASPYGVDCGPVTVTMSMRHVTKRFWAPAAMLPPLLRVYDVLMQRQVLHAIDVVHLKVLVAGCCWRLHDAIVRDGMPAYALTLVRSGHCRWGTLAGTRRAVHISWQQGSRSTSRSSSGQ
jgi:hypothetical protein